MSAFAVFGCPIKHSKSPKIYSLFANKFGISNEYDLKLASQENFDDMLYSFFNSGGKGANITLPFKERAVLLCNHLTTRATVTNSVNTIKKQDDGTLLGDNTDGIGFISDLKRLNWIDKNNMIVDVDMELRTVNILLIGAGGASRGILPMLLDITGCYINVVSRTFLRAQQLVQYYYSFGRQNLSCIQLDNLFCETTKQYDLIINATSSSMNNDIPQIPSFYITNSTKCYDVFYKQQDTAFIKWCKKCGSNYCEDGLGMLISQAAHSFYLWHGVFPNIKFDFNFLKSIVYVS